MCSYTPLKAWLNSQNFVICHMVETTLVWNIRTGALSLFFIHKNNLCISKGSLIVLEFQEDYLMHRIPIRGTLSFIYLFNEEVSGKLAGQWVKKPILLTIFFILTWEHFFIAFKERGRERGNINRKEIYRLVTSHTLPERGSYTWTGD